MLLQFNHEHKYLSLLLRHEVVSINCWSVLNCFRWINLEFCELLICILDCRLRKSRDANIVWNFSSSQTWTKNIELCSKFLRRTRFVVKSHNQETNPFRTENRYTRTRRRRIRSPFCFMIFRAMLSLPEPFETLAQACHPSLRSVLWFFSQRFPYVDSSSHSLTPLDWVKTADSLSCPASNHGVPCWRDPRRKHSKTYVSSRYWFKLLLNWLPIISFHQESSRRFGGESDAPNVQ